MLRWCEALLLLTASCSDSALLHLSILSCELRLPSSPRPPTYNCRLPTGTLEHCRTRRVVYERVIEEVHFTSAPNATLPTCFSLRRLVIHVLHPFQRGVVIFCCLLLFFELILRRLHKTHNCYFCVLWCCSQLNFPVRLSCRTQIAMLRTGVHVVTYIGIVVLLQLAVVLVMTSSSGVTDEYLPSDQFSKGSFVEDRRGLGSLCVASITNHPNSTTVAHEHVCMGTLGGGGLAVCICTHLVSLSWLCIVVMGTFTLKPRRWTPPHVLILIATVSAAVACLFFAIANVAALLVACVGLVLLVVNWHFGLRVCIAMSLAYWCSALWIGWTMSPRVGVALGVLAVVIRWSLLLFPGPTGAFL